MSNCICLGAVFALAVLVDANGEICGLSETASSVISILVFVTAFAAAIVLTAFAKGWWRLLGIACMVFYLALLFPLVAF